MNIFVLSEDPIQAAQYHCDKHVPKMCVELAQMLSTAHRILDGVEDIEYHMVKGALPVRRKKKKVWKLSDPLKDSNIYKAAYINHPCSQWVRVSSANYDWAATHLLGLCLEFEDRFQKQHKCFNLLNNYLAERPSNILEGNLTLWAQAMPEKYQHENPVIAYRNYYWHEKQRFAKWVKGTAKTPTWWRERQILEGLLGPDQDGFKLTQEEKSHLII